MKKVLMVILSIVLVSVLVAAPVQAAEVNGSISLDFEQVQPGEEVTVTFAVENLGEISALGLTYTVPEGLEVVSAQWLIEGKLSDVNTYRQQAVLAFETPQLLEEKVDVFEVTYRVSADVQASSQNPFTADVEMTLMAKLYDRDLEPITAKARITAVAPCTHSNTTLVGAKDATCAEEGYTGDTVCECGETIAKGEVIPATGEHDYHNGSCSVCGGKDPDYQEPSKPGWQSWFDKIFGNWWGNDDKCEHEYTSVVTKPTCTAKGYTTHTCSKCGDSYKDTYTNALGHGWDNGKVTKEATCTEDGVKTYTCGTCGATKTEAIKAPGHHFEGGVCTVCGEEEATKPGGSGWGSIWDWIFGWWN